MHDEGNHIAGHKALNAAQIGDINMVKHLGKQCKELMAYLDQESLGYDRRWLDVARTQLQLGLMSLTRAVAKNDFF
jgi:hypothetical protein